MLKAVAMITTTKRDLTSKNKLEITALQRLNRRYSQTGDHHFHSASMAS